MTEMLFVLTVIFVAYVAYVLVNEQKISGTAVKPTLGAEADKTPVAEAQVINAAKPVPAPAPLVSEPRKATKAKAPAKEAKKPELKPSAPVNPPVAAESGKITVRDPKTGEVSAIANNYRFTKRWIKEALVAEGLVDKIYKNNELDSEAEALVKTALAKFETMDKYKA